MNIRQPILRVIELNSCLVLQTPRVHSRSARTNTFEALADLFDLSAYSPDDLRTRSITVPPLAGTGTLAVSAELLRTRGWSVILSDRRHQVAPPAPVQCTCPAGPCEFS
jgi:hypothetical protein